METTQTETKVADTAKLDSAAIDNTLLIRLAEHTRTQLIEAKWQLARGLRYRRTAMGEMHLRQAARIVNALIGRD
jgi:hypothetical protein